MWELIPTAVGGFTGAGLLAGGCGISSRNCNSWWIHRCWTVSWWLWHHVGVDPNSSWWIHRCWTVSWWLWHPVGVESPTAVGGFTGAGLLAGGCGISSRNCKSSWIYRCWTVSWWLWYRVGVESPTAVGGFKGAGLLAGGCGISSWRCNSWWIHRCWTVSWWLWHHVGFESQTAVGSATVGGFTGAGLLAGGCRNMWELNPQQQLVDSQVLDCELVVVATASRNCNSWWIHRCWTVSWWLWHPVGVESPTADLGHQFFFPPPGPQLVPLYFVLLLLAEVAGEQMAQPLPYPPTGGIRLTVQQDQSARLSPSCSSFGGGRREQTARPLPYPPTGGIRLTVQQDQSPGSHRLVHSAPLFLVEVAGEQVAQPLPYPPTGGIRLTVQLDQSPGSRFPLLGITWNNADETRKVSTKVEVPLFEITWNNASENLKSKLKGRSFTSVQMFHTHAPLPRGHFVQRLHGMSLSSYIPEAGYSNEIEVLVETDDRTKCPASWMELDSSFFPSYKVQTGSLPTPWIMPAKSWKVSSKVKVLHLFRCFTHTPRCHEAILCSDCTGCR